MVCPKCGGRMKVVAFITEYAVVDKIIWHLKLTLVAEEAAAAYKDVDEVVRVSHELGIGRLVAKVVPIGVMKG